jgi:endonuclease-3
MNRKEKAFYVLQKMETLFPDAATELENWKTPFQFLICIILSAQTTDRQVNKITERLFSRYPDAELMSKARLFEIERLIKSVNFFRNKAKHILAMSKRTEEVYNGKVPDNEKDMLTLPGVGRKTANVFLNDLYKKNEGIAVDTHVARVAQRMGLTTNTNPDRISRDLEALYPKDIWYKVNSTFVLYGRYVCKARMTKSDCILKEYCSYCKNLPANEK